MTQSVEKLVVHQNLRAQKIIGRGEGEGVWCIAG